MKIEEKKEALEGGCLHTNTFAHILRLSYLLSLLVVTGPEMPWKGAGGILAAG